MSNINIACSLPQGIKLELLNSTGSDGHYPSVTLNGSNSNWNGAQPFIPPGPGITSIDGTFWASWIAANANLPMMLSGAIAVAS